MLKPVGKAIERFMPKETMDLIARHIDHFQDDWAEDWWSETHVYLTFGRGWWDRLRRYRHEITLWGEPVNTEHTEWKIGESKLIETLRDLNVGSFKLRAEGTKFHYCVKVAFARKADAVVAKLMLGTP